jgi:hypothetical protein
MATNHLRINKLMNETMQTMCPRVISRVLHPHVNNGIQTGSRKRPRKDLRNSNACGHLDLQTVTVKSLTLTEREIAEATGYRQPARQLRALFAAGIPADRRPDGSVRVWRHHVFGYAKQETKATRKRPKLTSDMKAT